MYGTPSLKAAYERCPPCGVQPDGSCSQCGGTCMWYGSTQAVGVVAATRMELSSLDGTAPAKLSGVDGKPDPRRAA